MSITIKELSEISGYSPATISRVINKKGNVKEETKLEIQKLLIEHGYRENFGDIRKAAYREKTILLLVGNIYNQFYIEQIDHMTEMIRRKNYISVICYTGDSMEEEIKYVEMAIQEGYAGVVFLNVRGGDALTDRLKKSEIPVVFLNRAMAYEDFDSVCSDNYRGGFIATKYLIERGHRRIGHLAGNMYSYTVRERMRGFADAMDTKGLPVSEHSVYYGDLDRDSGYRFGERMIKEGWDFTAVFCANDLMASGLLRACQDYGVTVPRDLSIICYDNTIVTRSLGLTCVGSSAQKMGDRALELLADRIRGNKDDGQSVLIAPTVFPGLTVAQGS